MKNNQINFIEIYSTDMKKTKDFYNTIFGWEFTDYGAEYSDIKGAGISGGFAKIEKVIRGGSLIVIYHDDLESVLSKIKKNGSEISKEIFSFPGGRRFQFLDPSGNELAVWSDK